MSSLYSFTHIGADISTNQTNKVPAHGASMSYWEDKESTSQHIRQSVSNGIMRKRQAALDRYQESLHGGGVESGAE